MAKQTHTTDGIILVCDGVLTQELEVSIQMFWQQFVDLLQLVRLDSNVGLGEALNQGLQHCQNEYVARMDCDDISLLERVVCQLVHMLEHQLDICGCTVIEFEDDGKKHVKSVQQSHQEIMQYAKKRNLFNHPSAVFKKSIILLSGGYQSMPYFENYYLWIRVLQKGARVGNVSQVLLHMRSDAAFYKRRGGVSYGYYLLDFWDQVAKIGYITHLAACVNIAVCLPVALMPNWAREKIHFYFLRT